MEGAEMQPMPHRTRVTPYQHRQVLSYRNEELLKADSVPFKPNLLHQNFTRAVHRCIFPVIQATAGSKHAAKKMDHVAQLLAAALVAGQAGKVLAAPRGQHGLFTAMADQLAWQGYMAKATGDKNRGLVSRYRLTAKGRQALSSFTCWRQVLDPLRERVVILRDDEGREPKLHNITSIVTRQADRIAKLNKFNLEGCQWVYDDNGQARPLMTCVRAIYKSDFNHGGRLYSSGVDGYQSLTKQQRRRVTVDGEPVAELDFSGFHPRMLYHLYRVDIIGDVYQPEAIFPAVYDVSNSDGLGGAELRVAARTLAKTSLNIMLNAGSESKAKGAIRRLLTGRRKKHGRWVRSTRRHRLFSTVVDTICHTDVAGVVEALRYAHRPIAHHFFTGVGMKLQAVFDGPMMVDILERMMILNMPALGIHDSVLCRLRDVDDARAIMQRCYALRFGFQPRIR